MCVCVCSMCAKTHITAKGGARSWWEFWCLRAHREGLKKTTLAVFGPTGWREGKESAGDKRGGRVRRVCAH